MTTIEDSSMPKLGTAAKDFEPTTKTCEVAAGLNFLIYYAEMGWSANPQKYIIKVEKSVQKTTWTYTRHRTNLKEAFPVEVSFQFVKIDQQEIKDK